MDTGVINKKSCEHTIVGIVKFLCLFNISSVYLNFLVVTGQEPKVAHRRICDNSTVFRPG